MPQPPDANASGRRANRHLARPIDAGLPPAEAGSVPQLALDGEDFDAMFAMPVTAWRTGQSVTATLRGTEIVALEPA
jgi:hypothetical protein